jgi:Na+:H+ antiporter, NhaA family
LRGWAIPTATDIAFALGVLSLLGNRVPASLKVFLTALAIIDDLGAVIIIALFYTSGLSLAWLAAAGAILVALIALNRFGVMRLAPYLVLGLILWVVVLKSGVHATLAGVALALTVPLGRTPGAPDHPEDSPLHALEHALHKPVSFFVIPVFGFANAGVPLGAISAESLLQPLTLGIALGLVVGKLVGVFGTAWLAVRLGFADMPANASVRHLLGVALLCGIGFTMSLFIGLLAFPTDLAMQGALKVGILGGSLISGLLGAAVLLLSPLPGGADSRS